MLYEGRQIFFGNADAAKSYFINMGSECALRQSTADFLTSLTNPAERLVRSDFTGKTPVTADEFAAVWQASPERAQLLKAISEFDTDYPLQQERGRSRSVPIEFLRNLLMKATYIHRPTTATSVVPVSLQIRLCMRRGYLRLRGDMANTVTGILFNVIMALGMCTRDDPLTNTTS